MRMSDLLDHPVRDVSGTVVGHVADVRLVQDGPPIGYGAAFRVHGLIVTHGVGSYLGYDRATVSKPWVVNWLMNLLHRGAKYADWSLVTAVENGEIRLSASAGDLPGVPTI